MKKYLVLGVLFLLPITAYIFFASGVNNFAKLPVLTPGVTELTKFHTLEGNPVVLKDHITVLGFFGNEVASKHGNAFNLIQKIYKKNEGFEDFQLVILLEKGTETEAKALQVKLKEMASMSNWKFVFGSTDAIQQVFDSLKTDHVLRSDYSTPYVFIIDKDRGLRGRDDDEDVGVLYGFDARDVAEINNKMSDDIKVILAEYRLELKKYKADREI
ncbi:MAG: hypothetical protein OQJ83_10875 [Altibacter sp.]|nr:hypothetical protein [Altibacter sp.]